MKSRRLQQLKCCKLFNKTLQRANLSTFQNQKIAPHCRITSGVCGPCLKQKKKGALKGIQGAPKNAKTIENDLLFEYEWPSTKLNPRVHERLT